MWKNQIQGESSISSQNWHDPGAKNCDPNLLKALQSRSGVEFQAARPESAKGAEVPIDVGSLLRSPSLATSLEQV